MAAPNPHSQKDITYHQETAHVYDQVVSEPREFANDLLFSAMKHVIPQGGSALDLGCGTGHMLLRYGSRFDQCIGVDHSAAMLEYAKRRLAERDDVRAQLVEADLFDYLEGATHEQFTMVSCVGCLHHLEPQRIERFFSLVAPLLKEGGRLLLAEPVSLDGRQVPHLIRRWNERSVMKERVDELLRIDVEEADEAPLAASTIAERPVDFGFNRPFKARGWELFPRKLPPSLLDRVAMTVLHRRYGASGNILAILWTKAEGA